MNEKDEKENSQLNDNIPLNSEIQNHINEPETSSLIDSNTDNELQTVRMKYSHIFDLGVDESIARKNSDPSITLIISIEASPSQLDSFWYDPAILSIISSGYIVVRLIQSKDTQEILQFSSLFYVRSIPSLYFFGPFSQGVTYAWTNQYPTISEFIQYVRNQHHPSTFSNYQSHSTSSFDTPTDPLLNFSDNTTDVYMSDPNETNQNQSISSKKPRLRSINSASTKIPPSQASKRQTARISVQLHNERSVFDLPNKSTVSDLLQQIEHKYGTQYSYYVPHLRKCIGLTTDELNLTMITANLSPSSLIQLQEPGDPGYNDFQIHPSLTTEQNIESEPYQPPPPPNSHFVSNAGLDAQPTLEIEESLPSLGHVDTHEVVPRLEVDEENPNRNENEGTTRCGCGWIKNFLSIFNPWGDLEEIEDFFQEKDY